MSFLGRTTIDLPVIAFRLGLSFILGGAIGNLIDRIRYGVVVDFLDAHVHQYHWPVFNVADSAISVGVSLLLLEMFLEWRRERRSN